MNKVIRSSVFLSALFFAPSTFSATSNVIFNGVVASTCVLTVGTPGTMTVNGDLTTLSSKNALGVPGQVTLTTTGGSTISVDPTVSNITKPAADTTAITWTPTFATSGAHNFADGTASHALATPGISLVTVHLTGAKGGGDAFVNGAYQATVTVRCEP